ncbi:MAG: hypothetical protein KDC53_05430, partial [Saprospiraceae bacterium]|nr:hypothetical protein [Saprospiraceae bacterium]
WRVVGDYTMSVGIHGDAYGNLGYIRGLIFVALFALFTRGAMLLVYKYSLMYFNSLVLWIPYIFFYSVRPGSEFYIISNWIVKSGFIVICFFLLIWAVFKKRV